jgi:hypothetical protein
MYAEPEKSRNPQSYHFSLIYVAACFRVIREATSTSEVSPSSHTCDNTLENLGRRAGNSYDNLCNTKIYHKITKYRYFDVSRFWKMTYGIS